jgi:hypothetical protein
MTNVFQLLMPPPFKNEKCTRTFTIVSFWYRLVGLPLASPTMLEDVKSQ